MAEISFKVLDLDNALKRRDPAQADSTSYDSRRGAAYRQAMANYAKQLRDEDSPFIKGDTFDEVTAPNTGTAKISTDYGEIFKVALVSAARAVAGDRLFIFDGADWLNCDRIKKEEITEDTVCGFWETKGQIHIYVKDLAIATPSDFHYLYWRFLDTTVSTPSTDVMDIIAEDFDDIVDAVESLLPRS